MAQSSFSPNSEHMVYAARKGTRTVMLLDGKEQKGV